MLIRLRDVQAQVHIHVNQSCPSVRSAREKSILDVFLSGILLDHGEERSQL